MDWKLKDKSQARQAVIPMLKGMIFELKKENISLKKFVLDTIKAIETSRPKPEKVDLNKIETLLSQLIEVTQDTNTLIRNKGKNGSKKVL